MYQYIRLFAVPVTALFILAGCSSGSSNLSPTVDQDNDEVVSPTVASPPPPQSPAVDRSDVRANGVKIYSNAFATSRKEYNDLGELILSSDVSVDMLSSTMTIVDTFFLNRPDLPTTSQITTDVLQFDNNGKFTRVEIAFDEQNPSVPVPRLELDLRYADEQLSSWELRTAANPSETTVARYQFDAAGRNAGGALFTNPGEEQTRSWSRTYTDTGWIETELDEDFSLRHEVELRDDGLVRSITADEQFGDFSEIRTTLFTYDDEGRLTGEEILSEAGEVIGRVEYLNYQTMDVFWHDIRHVFIAFSVLRE